MALKIYIPDLPDALQNKEIKFIKSKETLRQAPQSKKHSNQFLIKIQDGDSFRTTENTHCPLCEEIMTIFNQQLRIWEKQLYKEREAQLILMFRWGIQAEPAGK